MIIPEAAKKLYKEQIEFIIHFLETDDLKTEESWALLERKTHGIAGSASFFGDKNLIEISQELNTFIRQHPVENSQDDGFKQKRDLYLSSLKQSAIL